MNTTNKIKIRVAQSCPRCGGDYLTPMYDEYCPNCDLKIAWVEMYVALED